MMEFSLLEVVEFGCKGRYIGEKISYVQSNSCERVRLPIHSMRSTHSMPIRRGPVVDGRSRGRVPMTILNLELLEMISILSFFTYE